LLLFSHILIIIDIAGTNRLPALPHAWGIGGAVRGELEELCLGTGSVHCKQFSPA
jgi:hypothetical protein